MPTGKERSRDICKRLIEGQDIKKLARKIKLNLPPAAKVPAVPSKIRDMDKRQFLLEKQGVNIDFLSGKKTVSRNPESYLGNMENMVGLTQIPTGLVGPLQINGLHAQGAFYVPLATSEGALVASFNRGCRLITHAGGASTLVLGEQVRRAPGFVFKSIADAVVFSAWIPAQFTKLKQAAESKAGMPGCWMYRFISKQIMFI